MKRDINEIYKIIREKRVSAQNDLVFERCKRKYPSTKKQYLIQGEIGAYTDILVLLETSQILNEEELKNDKCGDKEDV